MMCNDRVVKMVPVLLQSRKQQKRQIRQIKCYRGNTLAHVLLKRCVMSKLILFGSHLDCRKNAEPFTAKNGRNNENGMYLISFNGDLSQT